MSVEKWAKDYQKFTDNPPAAGTVLRCYGNEDARLDLELVEGKPPFLYGRVYVPHIVGMELGWFLQPFDSDAAYGWKCILLPKAREEAIRRLGITEARLRVKALRVVRYSRTASSILCEIAEWCDSPDIAIKPGLTEEQFREKYRDSAGLTEEQFRDKYLKPVADKWAERGIPEVQVGGEILRGEAAVFDEVIAPSDPTQG